MCTEKDYIEKLKTCSFNFEEQDIKNIEIFFVSLRQLEQLVWTK